MFRQQTSKINLSRFHPDVTKETFYLLQSDCALKNERKQIERLQIFITTDGLILNMFLRLPGLRDPDPEPLAVASVHVVFWHCLLMLPPDAVMVYMLKTTCHCIHDCLWKFWQSLDYASFFPNICQYKLFLILKLTAKYYSNTKFFFCLFLDHFSR